MADAVERQAQAGAIDSPTLIALTLLGCGGFEAFERFAEPALRVEEQPELVKTLAEARVGDLAVEIPALLRLDRLPVAGIGLLPTLEALVAPAGGEQVMAQPIMVDPSVRISLGRLDGGRLEPTRRAFEISLLPARRAKSLEGPSQAVVVDPAAAVSLSLFLQRLLIRPLRSGPLAELGVTVTELGKAAPDPLVVNRSLQIPATQLLRGPLEPPACLVRPVLLQEAISNLVVRGAEPLVVDPIIDVRDPGGGGRLEPGQGLRTAPELGEAKRRLVKPLGSCRRFRGGAGVLWRRLYGGARPLQRLFE